MSAARSEAGTIRESFQRAELRSDWKLMSAARSREAPFDKLRAQSNAQGALRQAQGSARQRGLSTGAELVEAPSKPEWRTELRSEWKHYATSD